MNKQENTIEIRNMKNSMNIILSKNFRNSTGNIYSFLLQIQIVRGKYRQCKQTVVNQLDIEGETLTNYEDIAESFNNYFSNMGPNLANKIGTFRIIL